MTNKKQQIDFPFMELSILNGQYDQARKRMKRWNKVDMVDFIDYMMYVDEERDPDQVMSWIKTLIITFRKYDRH